MGRHEAQPRRLTRRGLQVTAAAAALVVALLVAVAVTRAARDPGTAPGAHRATSRTALPLSAGPGSSSPKPSSSASVSPTASTPMMAMGPTLALCAVGISWVEVRGPADRVLVARIFRKGDRATFSQSRVHLTVGNAAAVQVTANGMPVTRGRPGRVLLMTVVRGGD